MPVPPHTFGQFIHAKAEQFPDTVVLRFAHFDQPDEIVTYSMLAINGHKLAVALQRQGLTRGMTFGLMLRNHPEFVYALVGVCPTFYTWYVNRAVRFMMHTVIRDPHAVTPAEPS